MSSFIPRSVQHQMLQASGTSPNDINKRIRQGCNDGCGWAGDPFFSVCKVPPKHGRGWAVIFQEPGSPAVIVYRTDRNQPFDPDVIDHRAVLYLAEARRNYELGSKISEMMDAHDAKVQRDMDRQEIEMSIELSKMVGAKLRKEGKVQKKHKIDRKKD